MYYVQISLHLHTFISTSNHDSVVHLFMLFCYCSDADICLLHTLVSLLANVWNKNSQKKTIVEGQFVQRLSGIKYVYVHKA